MSEDSKTLAAAEIVKAEKARTAREKTRDAAQQIEADKAETQRKEQLKNDFVQQGLLRMLVGISKKQLAQIVSAAKENKRGLEGAKKAEKVEPQDRPKLKEVEIDGVEGVFGAILGAVAALTAGFVAGVAKTYKDIAMALKNLPALAIDLFKVVKSAFTFLGESLRVIGTETGITKAFTTLFTKLKSIATLGADTGRIVEMAIEEVRVFGQAFKNIGTGVVEFGKAILNGILKPFRALATGIKEIEIAKQFEVEINLLRGAFNSVVNFIRSIGTKIRSVIVSVGEALNPAIELTKNAFGRVKSVFVEIEKGIKAIGTGAETVKETTTAVSKTTSRAAGIFAEVRTLMLEVFEGAKLLGAAVSKAKGPIKLISEGLSGFVKAFKSVFAVIKPLGELVGRLFVPIIVVYETITNFFKAFTADGAEAKTLGEKLLAATLGTLTGIIEELVTVPLDLVKDIISWASKKMGFDSFSEALDSFSFTQFFDDFMEDLKFTFSKMWTFFGDELDALMSDPLQYAKDLLAIAAGGIRDMISSIGGMLKKAIIKVVNLIPGVNIPTESEDEIQERLEQEKIEERKEAFEEQGIVEVKGLGKRFGLGTATVSQEALEGLTNDQLSQLGKTYSDNEEIVNQVKDEMEKRRDLLAQQKAETFDFAAESFPEPVKANQPTMAEVLNPASPEPIVVVEPDAVPAVIVGGGQEAQALSNEMAVRQEALESSRGQSVGGGTNMTVASDNSINNYTDYTQIMPGPQPSTRDNTDDFMFLKSTGNR